MNTYRPKRRLTADQYIEGILKGDRVVLSRAITIVESNLESDKNLPLDGDLRHDEVPSVA